MATVPRDPYDRANEPTSDMSELLCAKTRVLPPFLLLPGRHIYDGSWTCQLRSPLHPRPEPKTDELAGFRFDQPELSGTFQ